MTFFLQYKNNIITFHLQVGCCRDGSRGVGCSDLVNCCIILIGGSDDQLVIASLELLGFDLGSICQDLLSTAVPFHCRLGMSHHLDIGQITELNNLLKN